MAPNVEIVHDRKLTLGKALYWDHEAQVLYYVDILESTVFKYNPSTKKVTWVIVDKKGKTPIGFVVPVAGKKDKFVIGYDKKFAVLTWDGVSTDPTSVEGLVEVDAGKENRFNDGKVDPSGRLWSGTMFKTVGDDRKEAALYSLSRDGKTAETRVSNVGLSCGLAWSTDEKTLFYIDTFNFAIDAFNYDIDSGKPTNRKTIFDLKKNDLNGMPDGMTIDKEDKLWFTTFGGSAIYRIDPKTGSILQSVQLPTSDITSVAWGGPKLDELYVTSASMRETEDNRHSGRLLKVTGLGTSGFPGVPVKL